MDNLLVGVGLSVISALITGAITGLLSSRQTIAALLVHIDYLRDGIARGEKADARIEQVAVRAHDRIDRLEKI